MYYTLQYILPVPLTEGEVLELYYSMDIIDETGTFYVDNIEYDFNGCDPGVYMLRNVYNTEGYANQLYVTGGPKYQYYRKDHLGNNREVWCANTNTTLQRTHYYPSGLPWRTTTGIGADVQNRKYNGKEFVEMHGLDEYDSEARWFYPAIVRTTTMDPLAELYYSFSPYTWCENNPVNSIDPTGMATLNAQTLNSTFIDENGNFIEHRDDEDNKVYQLKDVAAWRKNGSKKEDAEQVGFEYPRLDYNVYEKGESVIYFGSKALFMPGWLNDGPIVIDNTFETMAIPVFGWLKYLKVGKTAVKGVTYFDDLVKAAEKLYPKKVGKFELHHPFPKYIGGAKKQSLVRLPAPYHQQITNEFYKYWPKKLPGQPKVYPTAQQAQEIMQKVNSKFPLPVN